MATHNPLTTLEFPSQPNGWEALSGSLKALGDPLRLQILRVLSGDSFSVSELCDVFKLRQSALSHHLKVMVNAHWLTRRRDGTAIYYRRQLAQGDDAALRNEITAAVDAQPLPESLMAGLEAVQQARENNSRVFFRDHAEAFRAQQELIAHWEDYSAASLHLLDSAGLPSGATLLELGPGEGRLLQDLANRGGHVVALDNAAAMLDRARVTAGHLSDIEFKLGDTRSALAEGLSADAIVINMVLHHTPDPETVLAESAQLLRPGGVIVVSELCAHDQGWARDHCGDLWLGFDADQLAGWAEAAGLSHRARLFIAQRNGFQIQVQLFQLPLVNKGSEK